MIYVFEHYSLDTDRRELRRGAELFAVEPQIFDVLEYLIRNRERVVSDDELIAAVWHGRIVSESTFSSRMSEVRQAVGDSGKLQRLIRTVSRKGYRFIAQVREERGPADGGGEELAAPTEPQKVASPPPQAVTFCKTKDDINLAVATVGCGPVLVRAAHWAISIEYDWQGWAAAATSCRPLPPGSL